MATVVAVVAESGDVQAAIKAVAVVVMAKKKKCKKGLLGAIMCLVKKIVKAVGKGVKHVGKKLGDAFKFKQKDNHGDSNVVVYEYAPVDKNRQLMFKEAGSTFVYENPKLPQNPQSNMMQRPHEKMVCRMPEQSDELPSGAGSPGSGSPNSGSPNSGPQKPGAGRQTRVHQTRRRSTKTRLRAGQTRVHRTQVHRTPNSSPKEPKANPADAFKALDSPSPIPVCKDKKPPMDPKILVPDVKDKEEVWVRKKVLLESSHASLKKWLQRRKNLFLSWASLSRS